MSDTASKLKCWAGRELGYCGPVSAEDLSSICVGSMNTVWGWIISHCLDREKVKTIQGNLLLMKKKVEGRRGIASSEDGSLLCSGTTDVISTTLVSETERDLLMADRSRLLGEIHAMVVKVQRLKVLHNHSKTECVKLDNQRAEKMSNIDLRRRKVVLLNLYLRQISNLLSNLQSKTSKLSELYQREVTKTKSSTLISCEKGILTEDSRKVEELIVEISRMFSCVLAGETVQGRSDVRSRVVQSLAGMSAVSTARSLAQFTEALARKVHQQREEKHVTGGADLEDGNEESVESAVDQMNRNLVSCHFAAKKHVSSVDVWRENVSVMMKKAGVAEEEILPIELSARKASLANSLSELRRSLAGKSINSSVLQDLVAMQQNQIDGLCGTISSLISSSSIATLKRSQQSTLETMSSSLPCLATELTKVSYGVENIPSSQLNVLGFAPLCKLSSTNLTGESWVTMTPTSQLSILRNKGKFPSDPSQSSSDRENSLAELTKLLADISMKEEMLAEENSSRREQGKGLSLFEHLARSLQTNITEQSRNLMPIIEECVKQQKEVLQKLGRFEALHQDWRSQPAAEVAAEETLHWGEVEGKSLKQLQDLAKCYINKLGL